MAKFNSKKTSELKGVIGNVVFTHWKAVPVVKIKPGKRTKPPSPKQLFQRAKMNAVMNFLRPYRLVVNKYFDEPTPYNTLHNLANSYFLNHALEIEGETIKIALDKVILTKGGIRGLEEVQISTEQEGKIQLSWKYTPNEAGTHPDDELYVAFYDPNSGSGLLLMNIAKRQEAQVTLPLQQPFTDSTIHLWAGFIAHDGSQVSWSGYLGSFFNDK